MNKYIDQYSLSLLFLYFFLHIQALFILFYFSFISFSISLLYPFALCLTERLEHRQAVYRVFDSEKLTEYENKAESISDLKAVPGFTDRLRNPKGGNFMLLKCFLPLWGFMFSIHHSLLCGLEKSYAGSYVVYHQQNSLTVSKKPETAVLLASYRVVLRDPDDWQRLKISGDTGTIRCKK